MEVIRDIAASISVSAVIIGAIHILAPDGKNGRQLRYIAGLLLIVAVVAPFAGASISFDLEQAETTLHIDSEAMLKNQIENVVAELLRSEGIEFGIIKPYMDISPDGSISIYRIYVSHASEAEKAKQIIGENFTGCEVEVGNER